MSGKLWSQKSSVDQAIERFTTGDDPVLDLRLAEWDILGSIAHATMLGETGIIPAGEAEKLVAELRRLYPTVRGGDFTIDPGVEDIHSQVELLLTAKLGDTGKRVHTGRSRNDQVLVDLRLYFRDRIEALVGGMDRLFSVLQGLSEQHKDVLLPGFTHLQVAMPSSFGLWFGAYAESLADDLQLFQTAHNIINKNPLGSAAGYGTSLPISRQRTADLLGFADLDYNVVYAQMGRGRSEWFLAQAMAAVAWTLSHLSADIILYLNQNFAYISFPENVTTGSSIMPHKKNPDVFELVRARCNRLQSLPGQISGMLTNLTSGYHRDLQLLKEITFPAIDHLTDCLAILNHTLPLIAVKTDILSGEQYKLLYSVEAANRMVAAGVPFRDAYHEISGQIKSGHFAPPEQLAYTHEGSIGNPGTERITARWRELLSTFPFAQIHAALVDLAGG